MRLQLVPAFTLIAGIVLGFALHALTVGPTAGLPSLQAAPRPFERRSISVNSPIAPASGVPPAWNPGEALMSTGFQCVDGRDKPWAIIHESDYDSRTLRVMWKWVPEYRAALPELLTRGWWVVRIGPSQSQPSHESSSARTRSDEACLAAPASCLHLTSDVLARLPFPCPSCGASHDTATLAARNAAALLAAACGASHVLELEASVMINVSVPVTYLLNPTSAAWAAGPAGLRDRMAGAGTVKIVAADEPPSGGFVHALAALGEPLLFARGLPVARVPNVSMSALDMRAPMDELPPAVAIHVFVPGGTPDLSAATRAFFRGQLPRRVYATRNKVINPGSEPPLGNALHVRALNPGSFAVFGGVATLWSREAFGVMLLPPASACTPEVGVWGAESARSLVATATLHLSGATVAFVGGLQPFYRPFAPVTTAELLAEAATDVLIEVTAGVLVPAVREQLADPAQGFPLDTAAASDAVTAALLAAGALPLESVHEWQRWSADLSGVGWLPMPPEKQSRARQGGRSGLFTSPLGLCNDPIAAPPAVHRVRAAVCVTGEVHNIDSLVSALGGLDPYFPGGNMHVFFFGAAFLMPHKEMQNSKSADGDCHLNLHFCSTAPLLRQSFDYRLRARFSTATALCSPATSQISPPSEGRATAQTCFPTPRPRALTLSLREVSVNCVSSTGLRPSATMLSARGVPRTASSTSSSSVSAQTTLSSRMQLRSLRLFPPGLLSTT